MLTQHKTNSFNAKAYRAVNGIAGNHKNCAATAPVQRIIQPRVYSRNRPVDTAYPIKASCTMSATHHAANASRIERAAPG